MAFFLCFFIGQQLCDRPVCSLWPWLWWPLSWPLPCCCGTWASVSSDWLPGCWLSSWWTSWHSAGCAPNPWPWSWLHPTAIKKHKWVLHVSIVKAHKTHEKHRLSYHLSLFGHLLNVSNYLLLLLLQLWSLPVQLPHGPIECPLILFQHLFWCLPASKQELHLLGKQIMHKSQMCKQDFLCDRLAHVCSF